MLVRRCRVERVVNMKLPVAKSAPVRMIATRPKGKMRAANSLITPGAFSWYHGAVLTVDTAAQANARIAPAMKEDVKILSTLMLAFAAPIRDAISVVC